MPELGEVAFHAKAWRPAVGQRVESVAVHEQARCARGISQAGLEGALRGCRLASWRSHGKRILMEFAPRQWLGIHLGMTGSLAARDLSAEPDRHDHLVIRCERVMLVFRDPRQFGRLAWQESDQLPRAWRALPPQPQDDGFTFACFATACLRRKGSLLKSFLLQQDVFPGVGNWMADEISWRAALRPDRRVASLDEAERRALFRATRFVCRGAMRHIAPDYGDVPRSWLFHYRWKDGGRCPKTGEALRREEIGGRTTCWSPAWQS